MLVSFLQQIDWKESFSFFVTRQNADWGCMMLTFAIFPQEGFCNEYFP